MDATARLPEPEDTRTDGPMTGSARDVLGHWLDLYRSSLLLKMGGLDGEQLCRRSVPPSSLSLIGLVRHLTEVEAYWVRVVLEGDESVPDYWCVPERPDGDVDDVDPETALADAATYRDEIATTARLLAHWTDLDALAIGRRRGREVNLGWILSHLVEEYARHLGHADLLREAIDGRTG
jgi:hypothetical protein